MSSDLQRMLERQRATNKPIDAQPMNLLYTLISTQKGWIIRQVLKFASYGGTAFTAWLTAHNVPLSDPQAITAALSTLAIGILELGLSRFASGIAAK